MHLGYRGQLASRPLLCLPLLRSDFPGFYPSQGFMVVPGTANPSGVAFLTRRPFKIANESPFATFPALASGWHVQPGCVVQGSVGEQVMRALESP